MARITAIEGAGASGPLSDTLLDRTVDALEAGQVLFFPELAFVPSTPSFFTIAAAAAVAKNLSFDPASGQLKGLQADHPSRSALHDAMSAYARFARGIVERLLPRYQDALETGRTSFRPAEIAGRQSSWRKDDTRLHVDSFPSTPVQGRRILRFFSNVNPDGKVRHWRVGGPFAEVAEHFLPRVRGPLPGSDIVLSALHVTKSRRTPYDHYMLKLHDAMKADLDYQVRGEQEHVEFPPGSSWMVYTDLVPHAAMSGQHAFEQTFYLPLAAMRDPSRAPLYVLETLKQRKLV